MVTPVAKNTENSDIKPQEMETASSAESQNTAVKWSNPENTFIATCTDKSDQHLSSNSCPGFVTKDAMFTSS